MLEHCSFILQITQSKTSTTTMKPLITIAIILVLVAYSDGESLRTSTEEGIVSAIALDNKKMERNGNSLNVNQAYDLDRTSTGNDPRRPPNAGKPSQTLSPVVDKSALCCFKLTNWICNGALTRTQKHAAHTNVPKCGGCFKHMGRKRADGSSENRDCQKIVEKSHTSCPGLRFPPFGKTQNRQLVEGKSEQEESKQEGRASRCDCSSDYAGMQGNTLCSKLGKPQEEGRPDELMKACLITMSDIEENAPCCTPEGPHEGGRPDELVKACLTTILCSDEPMQPLDHHPRSHAGSNRNAWRPRIQALSSRFPDDHSHDCSEQFPKCYVRCVNGVKYCIRGTYKALRFCLWDNIRYPIGCVLFYAYMYLCLTQPPGDTTMPFNDDYYHR